MPEHDAYDQLLDALNAAMLDEARWPEASARIEAACGTRGGILALTGDFPLDNLDIRFATSRLRGERRPDLQQDYFRRYHHEDEHLPRLRALPDGRIVPLRDLFSEDERRTSVAYNEAMPRYEIQNGLNVRLNGPRGTHIVWGLSDPVAGDGWSPSQTAMVARLLPHVRQYVRVRSALADAEALGASFAGLIDNTRMGLIHLDPAGRIVEANDRAMALLRGNDGLRDDGRLLRAVDPEEDARLQALLARALPRFGSIGRSGSMAVRRTWSRRRLAVHIGPVATREGAYRARNTAALVLVVDPADRAQATAGQVQAMLGLTPAEAEIAVLIARGLTLRQIAAATGREHGTVRSHLRNMFRKLGYSRQLDVAQAVLALTNLPAE